MSGVRWSLQTGEIATGTSLKTLVQAVAAANHRVKIREISISFTGVDNTAVPILVKVVRQSTAGTSSALSPVKICEGDDETLQVTGRHTATVEPTTGETVMSEEVHPQTGFIWQAPSKEDEIDVIGGNRLGVSVTAAASVSAVVRIRGEE